MTDKPESQTTTRARIKRVKKVLDRFVPRRELGGSKAYEATIVLCGGSSGSVMKFKDGTWTMMSHDDIQGVVGGYSWGAEYALGGLVSLRMISQKDADAFEKWFRVENHKISKARALKEAHETAREHGLVLVKRPERPAEKSK